MLRNTLVPILQKRKELEERNRGIHTRTRRLIGTSNPKHKIHSKRTDASQLLQLQRGTARRTLEIAQTTAPKMQSAWQLCARTRQSERPSMPCGAIGIVGVVVFPGACGSVRHVRCPREVRLGLRRRKGAERKRESGRACAIKRRRHGGVGAIEEARPVRPSVAVAAVSARAEHG